MTTEQLWSKFEQKFQDAVSLSGAIATLSWDRETMLPSQAAQGRAQQLEYLEKHFHELITEPDYVATLHALHSRVPDLTEVQARAVRHQFRKVQRSVRVPSELVARKSAVTSQAYAAWNRARSENDFSLFSNDLKS
ncbi:MAG: hypothetical protein EOP09_09265, partial [Proteobacteria bacterium]